MAAFTAIALVAIAAGAAVSAVGAIKSGQAQKKMSDQQAAFDLEAAEGNERDYKRETSFVLAARRAGLGAQGVRQEGTPQLVDDSVVTESELQGSRISTGAQKQAAITRQGGKNAQTAGYYRGGASLLSGIGSVGSMGQSAGYWGSSAGATV